MATKTREPQPAVRKSFLVIGGVLVAVVLTFYVLMNFVLSDSVSVPDDPPTGGVTQPADEGFAPPPAPEPGPEERQPGVLRPGGRDPFSPSL